MTPPYTQRQVLDFRSAGCPFISTSFLPPIQGNGVLGTQGMGVRCPWFAAVAEPVAGNATVWHLPKGAMLRIGTWSLILPWGCPVSQTVRSGNTVSVAILSPHEHLMRALEHT